MQEHLSAAKKENLLPLQMSVVTFHSKSIDGNKFPILQIRRNQGTIFLY